MKNSNQLKCDESDYLKFQIISIWWIELLNIKKNFNFKISIIEKYNWITIKIEFIYLIYYIYRYSNYRTNNCNVLISKILKANKNTFFL